MSANTLTMKQSAAASAMEQATALPAVKAETSTVSLGPGDRKKNVTYPFWLGGAASCVAATFSHPFDLVKVRLQTTLGASNNGAFSTVIKIVRNEGFMGLYGGLSASLLRQATYSTMRFGAYEKFKSFVGREGEVLSFPKMILCAAAAGGIGGAFGNPADVVVVRMQNDMKLEPHLRRNYKHVFDGLAQIVREESVKGLFRGVGPNVNRAMLMTVSQLATYDKFKAMLLNTNWFCDNIYTHFVASLLSGLVATTLCSPVDVIKTRVMNSATRSQGVSSILLQIIRQEGVRALFKGWVPAYVRLGPHTMVTFLTLEQFRALYLRFDLYHVH